MQFQFVFQGSLRYARGERGMWDAIARSLARRLEAPVTCWPVCTHSSRAQWYDVKAAVYKEEIVRTYNCGADCVCGGS